MFLNFNRKSILTHQEKNISPKGIIIQKRVDFAVEFNRVSQNVIFIEKSTLFEFEQRFSVARGAFGEYE